MKKLFLLVVSATFLLAHSGGTNSAGCHTNSKTGDYHCHKSNVDLLKCDVISKNNTTEKKHTHKVHSHKEQHTKS